MKVILLSSYGGRIPSELKTHFFGNDDSWRWGNLVGHIEAMAIPAEAKNSQDASVVQYAGAVPGIQTYLFRTDNIVISIVDVDISRPWTICKYDGAEYIQYLDYQVVFSEIGFCRLPK